MNSSTAIHPSSLSPHPSLRILLAIRKKHDFQRLMFVEFGHPFMKILQGIVGRLHDPLDVEAGSEQSEHALPGPVHTAADDALQLHTFEDDVARVVVDRHCMAGG